MNRRKFLTIAGIGGAVVSLASLKFFTTPFEQSAARIIHRELDFLDLDPEGVAAFVSAYTRNKDKFYKLTMKSYGLLGIDASRSGKIHQMVSLYLLSTDFFVNKMDESRTIKYVALYDPYIKPCAHPFSHLQYPEENS